MRLAIGLLVLIVAAGCSSAAGTVPKAGSPVTTASHERAVRGVGYVGRFTLVPHGDPGSCSTSGVLVTNPDDNISVAVNSHTLVQVAACNAASGDSMRATVSSTYTESPYVDTQVATCGDGGSSSDCGDFAIDAGSTGYAEIAVWDRTTGATHAIHVTIGTP